MKSLCHSEAKLLLICVFGHSFRIPQGLAECYTLRKLEFFSQGVQLDREPCKHLHRQRLLMVIALQPRCLGSVRLSLHLRECGALDEMSLVVSSI